LEHVYSSLTDEERQALITSWNVMQLFAYVPFDDLARLCRERAGQEPWPPSPYEFWCERNRQTDAEVDELMDEVIPNHRRKQYDIPE
jgi:hypothetical protein